MFLEVVDLDVDFDFCSVSCPFLKRCCLHVPVFVVSCSWKNPFLSSNVISFCGGLTLGKVPDEKLIRNKWWPYCGCPACVHRVCS